jgi:hypothetical protein
MGRPFNDDCERADETPTLHSDLLSHGESVLYQDLHAMPERFGHFVARGVWPKFVAMRFRNPV